jgi:IMP and pyridine-specific 5'-nucleotidase
LWQAHAIARTLKLACFDGDETLYTNRSYMDVDSPLIDPLLEMLQRGIHVALVTAVGYDSPEPFEERLNGLLNAMVIKDIPAEARERLWVVGGECNYVFRCDADAQLRALPRSEWETDEMKNWEYGDMVDMLDAAESTLRECAKRFSLPMRFIRKDRAVGALYVGQPNRKTNLYLDELALEVRRCMCI